MALKDWPLDSKLRALPRVITDNPVGSFRDSSCLHVLSLASRVFPPFICSLAASIPHLSLSLLSSLIVCSFFFLGEGVNTRSAETSMGQRRQPHLREITPTRRVSLSSSLERGKFLTRESCRAYLAGYDILDILDIASYRRYRFSRMTIGTQGRFA